jgi:hypothetical protein
LETSDPKSGNYRRQGQHCPIRPIRPISPIRPIFHAGKHIDFNKRRAKFADMEFFIIGSDNNEYGPVDTATLRDWVERNRADGNTRARLVGEEPVVWRPLASFPEFADLADSAPPLLPDIEDNARETVSVDEREYAAQIIARSGHFSVRKCLRRAWALSNKEYGSLLGVCFLFLAGVGVIYFFSKKIPLFDGILFGAFVALLSGGLCYFLLGKLRGRPRSAGDIFKGFEIRPMHLALAGIVTYLITNAWMLLGVLVSLSGLLVCSVDMEALTSLLKAISVAGTDTKEITVQLQALKNASANDYTPSLIGVGLIAGGLVFTLFINVYLIVVWRFTNYLIIDRRLGFWNAMGVGHRVVRKQWGKVFALGVVAIMTLFAGALALFVGIFFVFPFVKACEVCAYEMLFNPKTAIASGTPSQSC